MLSDVWDRYPVLTAGIEIHLNPLGGTLFVQGEPFKVVPAAAEFLSKCNGRRTLREAVPSSWNRDFEDLEFIFFAARAVHSGWLELRDVPTPHSSRILSFPRLSSRSSLPLPSGCSSAQRARLPHSSWPFSWVLSGPSELRTFSSATSMPTPHFWGASF